MRNTIFLTGFLLTIATAGCSDGDKSTNPQAGANLNLTPVQGRVIGAADEFGLEVYQRTVAARPDENVFLSPLSISIALGMVLNGAEGQTRQAILDCLHLTGAELDEVNAAYAELMKKLPVLDPNVTMEIANSAWYREGFPIKDSFLEVTDSVYSAEVAGLDFSSAEAPRTINGWVADKTHDKIQSIIQPPISPLSMLFLINAVYFYGNWTIQFDSAATYSAPFHLSGGTTVQCRMMQMHQKLEFFQNQQIKAVRLPYGDGDFAMLAILPADGSPVNDLISGLTVEQWQTWLQGLARTRIDLFMPRFTFSFEILLNQILSEMGMGLAFTPDADLTRIADVSDLHISEVRHKAFVDVNESGTEAAAVTSVGVGVTSVGPTHPVMRLDRPFAFIIYEESTGTMIFAGKVAEPAT